MTSKALALGTGLALFASACGAPDQPAEAPTSVHPLVGLRGAEPLRYVDLARTSPAQARALLARLSTDPGTSKAEIECWSDPWRVICTNRTIGVTCTVEHGGTNPECHNEDGD